MLKICQELLIESSFTHIEAFSHMSEYKAGKVTQKVVESKKNTKDKQTQLDTDRIEREGRREEGKRELKKGCLGLLTLQFLQHSP